jgi:hypothetical protein
MENDGGQIAINAKFDKLITSLRTAVANESTLDKRATSLQMSLYLESDNYKIVNLTDSNPQENVLPGLAIFYRRIGLNNQKFIEDFV